MSVTPALVAITSVAPFAKAVARPAVSMLATLESFNSHVNVAPAMTFPSESFADASNVVVSPIEFRVALTGMMSTLAAAPGAMSNATLVSLAKPSAVASS